MLKLFPYQVEGVRQINRFGGRVLLADSMGLGKSLQSISWLSENVRDRCPAVIVCPAIVKPNWERHVRLVLDDHPMILEGRTSFSLTDGFEKPSVCIINYDILKDWLEELINLNPRTLILDEVQNCTNPRTKRTKACVALSRETEYMLALSGTPLMQRTRELFPTLNMLLPTKYSKFWPYAKKYCKPRMTPWGWSFDGASNLKQLHDELRNRCMIRRTREDVKCDLPEAMRETVLVELSKGHRVEYNEAATAFIQWIRENKGLARAKRAKRAEQFVKASALRMLTARGKLRSSIDWINNWLEESDPEEKLVVFAVHRGAIRILAENSKSRSICIDGGVPSSKRAALIKAFRKDPKTRICFASLLAAGAGLDGLQVASRAAFVELPWRPSDCHQAECRINRLGGGSTVWISYLVAARTIEERICELLQRKGETVSMVLDGTDAVEEVYVFDEILKALDK